MRHKRANTLYCQTQWGIHFLKILRLIIKQHLKPLSGVAMECYFRKFLYFSETDNLTSTPTQCSNLFFTLLLPSLFMFRIKCKTTNTFTETLSKSSHQLYQSCLANFFTFDYGHSEQVWMSLCKPHWNLKPWGSRPQICNRHVKPQQQTEPNLWPKQQTCWSNNTNHLWHLIPVYLPVAVTVLRGYQVLCTSWCHVFCHSTLNTLQKEKTHQGSWGTKQS